MGSEKYARQAGATPEKFLKAAGYDDGTAADSAGFGGAVAYREVMMTVGVISRAFTERGWTYQLLPASRDFNVDFAFKVEDAHKAALRWEFFLGFPDTLRDTVGRHGMYFYLMGRIVTFEADNNTQLTILLSDEALYDQLEEGIRGRTAAGRVSIALIDMESMQIKKEVPLNKKSRCILKT